jgi:hypothetical protein
MCGNDKTVEGSLARPPLTPAVNLVTASPVCSGSLGYGKRGARLGVSNRREELHQTAHVAFCRTTARDSTRAATGQLDQNGPLESASPRFAEPAWLRGSDSLDGPAAQSDT